MATVLEVVNSLKSRYSGITETNFRDQSRITVASDQIRMVLSELRHEFKFDLLVDITCVDYLNYRNAEHRFGLAYLLCNVDSNIRLTVRTYLDEPNLTVPTAVLLWEGANWLEREVWDMFGIVFDGHPDLRRILMPEEFTAHPLRKDYPLQGRGERHNFTPIRRAQA